MTFHKEEYMPILPIDTSDGSTDYRYFPPQDNILEEKKNKWLNLLCSFLKSENIGIENVDIEMKTFIEILVRIDKRREYFKIYHDGTTMNELKETALLAYWIMKFKPFYLKGEPLINERFSLFIVYGVCKATYDAYGLLFVVSSRYKKQLKYAFIYWELSKESIIMIIQSLCPFHDDKLGLTKNV